MPQFSHLKNGNNYVVCVRGIWGILNEMMNIKVLAWCMATGKHCFRSLLEGDSLLGLFWAWTGVSGPLRTIQGNQG